MGKTKLQTLGSKVTLLEQRTALPVDESDRANPYRDPRWAALVLRLKRQRGARCEKCSRTHTRIFADHIVELKDGGELLDEHNVQLLCGRCHTIKTNVERAKRTLTPVGGSQSL